VIKLMDGTKNSVVVIQGYLDSTTTVLSLKDLSGKPTSVRLEGILFALSGKIELRTDEVQIPLDSRGKLNFEEFHAIPVTSDISILPVDLPVKYFIMLDLEKL
jgi:hypothetical protein